MEGGEIMDLYKLRMEIDRVDTELLPLLLRRMDLVHRAGALKNINKIPLHDTSREMEILENVCDPAPPEYKESIKEIYEKIMEISRKYQAELLEDKNL